MELRVAVSVWLRVFILKIVRVKLDDFSRLAIGQALELVPDLPDLLRDLVTLFIAIGMDSDLVKEKAQYHKYR